MGRSEECTEMECDEKRKTEREQHVERRIIKSAV